MCGSPPDLTIQANGWVTSAEVWNGMEDGHLGGIGCPVVAYSEFHMLAKYADWAVEGSCPMPQMVCPLVLWQQRSCGYAKDYR